MSRQASIFNTTIYVGGLPEITGTYVINKVYIYVVVYWHMHVRTMNLVPEYELQRLVPVDIQTLGVLTTALCFH